MENEGNISNVCSGLQQIAENAAAAFGDLSAHQLNWKPAPDEWSVAQCLDHLLLTNGQMSVPLKRKVDGEANSFWETWSPLSGVLGPFLLKSMKADDKKFKAPSQTIVPPSELPADIVGKFRENIDEVIAIIRESEKLDPHRAVITSPFMRLMTYRLSDGLNIMVEHCRRHIRQAKRVMGTPGFPA
jgi:hypothetical protein